MNDSGNSPKAYFEKTVYGLNAQAIYQKGLLQSEAMVQYRAAIERNVAVLREAMAESDFDALLSVEMAIQKVEAERFSHDAHMTANIQKTQSDLAEGMKDYRHLMETPKSYCSRGYREQDRVGPNKKFSLDTMRKALRGQATRVGNFAKNPMLFPIEKKFHLLRVAPLKRAEKLYEALQAQTIAENE